FELRTLSFFMVLSFLMTAFLFWKKGREEHYPEIQLFDGFLLASMLGFIIGRVGYVLSQLNLLGWSVFKWVDVFN
ncbi:MAG: phosphatidylglycerol---prolipoprotein diacylglyceryl transferase, partial [Patescibacteria group bacterium]|nr:phosphatidylglycerol---prolipoprotein diacylglyceryl transferase [Patescibacteria group bacterium]